MSVVVGGRYSEVVVISGLTVFESLEKSFISVNLILCFNDANLDRIFIN